jgi:hypothetical protein
MSKGIPLCSIISLGVSGHRDKSFQFLNLYVFFFFLTVLGLELRVFTLSHSTSPFFVMGFYEIVLREPFAWAGFVPGSS